MSLSIGNFSKSTSSQYVCLNRCAIIASTFSPLVPAPNKLSCKTNDEQHYPRYLFFLKQKHLLRTNIDCNFTFYVFPVFRKSYELDPHSLQLIKPHPIHLRVHWALPANLVTKWHGQELRKNADSAVIYLQDTYWYHYTSQSRKNRNHLFLYWISNFPALGFVNFDFSLIIFVGTLPTSCRCICLKFSLRPHFQISGYANGLASLLAVSHGIVVCSARHYGFINDGENM